MVTLFADGERNREAVARWRKRARGERRVRAGRILEVIEVEDEFTELVDAIGGEASVEESAGGIGGSGAGSIAKDEEKFGDGGIFEDRFEAIGFSGELEFGGAGNV